MFTSSTNAGTNNTNPERLFLNAGNSISSGTSYTNILYCNNLKLSSSGILVKETINNDYTSTYTKFLTVPDCGVYMYNSADALYPLYTSCTYNTNVYNQAHTSGTITSYGDTGVNGSSGVGSYGLLNLANKDDGYIVHPKYAITVIGSTGSTTTLNYQNNTNKPVYVLSSSPNTGDSIKIYYNGVELI